MVYTECVLEQSEWSLPDVVQEFTVYHKDTTKKTTTKQRTAKLTYNGHKKENLTP